MSMNTDLGDSVRLHHMQASAKSEIRRLMKLVKIREDVRKIGAEQKIPEEETLQVGFEQKAREFATAGGGLHTNPES
jgi:hypothetical protein